MKITAGGRDTVGDMHRVVQSIPTAYTIWKDGTTYRAESNIDGGTDYGPNADASTVIQQAIDALSTGGTILFRSGDYYILIPVNIHTKILHIKGEGVSCTRIITTTNITAMFYSTEMVSALTISDIALHYDYAGVGGKVLKLTGGAAQIRIINTLIDNDHAFTGDAIYIAGNNPYEFYMKNCSINWASHLIYYAGSEITLEGNKFGGAPGTVIELLSCGFGHIVGNAFEGAYVFLDGTSSIVINDNWFGNTSYDWAIKLNASSNCTINGNHIYDVTLSLQVYGYGIQLYDSNYNVVIGNNIRIAHVNTRGIGEAGTSDYNNISDNNLIACIDSKLAFVGTHSEGYNNLGAMFEGRGNAVIVDGQNHVHVAHGLSWTPLPSEITLTATAQTTNDFGYLTVSGITDAEFVIYCTANPGASNLYVSWFARRSWAPVIV
jgi:hypothetical protein